MEPTPGSQHPPAPQLRLNGWKEIANHLGKSVRSVQRWEKEYGLPVHRIGREGGEIVFALSDEVDRWAIRNASRPDAESELAPSPVAPAAPAAPVAPAIGRWLRPFVVVVGMLIVVVPTLWMWGTGARPQPASATVQGEYLVVKDAEGRRLWQRRLGFVPGQRTYDAPNPPAGAAPILLADLDRDGSVEVIFRKAALHRESGQGVTVFNSDGTERFTTALQDTVKFGTTEYAGPWAAYRMFVTDDGGGRRSLWVAFIHGLWFPSLLVELDASGATKGRYWSNGYIESVTVATWAGREVVLVGGTHNETKGASLAVFSRGAVSGSAPATVDRYRCTSCGPGGPAEFLVFPRQSAARALDGQATINETWVDEHGRIHVLASEGPAEDGHFGYGVWYALNPDLSIQERQFTSSSKAVHEGLVREGAIHDPFGEAPPATTGVLRWTGRDFEPLIR